jgi:radical SAM-linked protein
MVEDTLNRFRIRYSKTQLLRFIGHLDMLRTWERTLRRAQIPMAYSQGFHPHQRINLGIALPLGFSSDCELIDLWLKEEVGMDELLPAIAKAIPPGIKLHNIERVDLSSPSLQQEIQYAEYRVRLGPDRSSQVVREAVSDLLNQVTVKRERRGKTYDIRPLIESIEVAEGDDGVELQMRLSANQKGTGRPDEVLRALGYEPEQAQIARTRLFMKE